MTALEEEKNGVAAPIATATSDKQESTSEESKVERQLKLDKHGLPLVPQPSDSPDDPLNWPHWLKCYIVLLVSGLGFIINMGSALINPAFVQMSEDLDITVQQASYCTTIFILFSGITPMFVAPLVNVYGRRYFYLAFILVAILSQLGSGIAANYGGVVVGRVFYGIGGSLPLGIGAATICDLFTQGERGLYMGIYTLFVNNGPHIAPIIGGYIALNISWRWCFYVPGIIAAGLWVVMIFTFPETLYSREEFSTLSHGSGGSFASKLKFKGKVLQRDLKPKDFIAPFRMIQYWAVSLPAMYWMTSNTYGSALYAITGSHIAQKLYDFNVAQTGLLMGLPLTVGAMLGEAMAGWVSDLAINAYARRHNGVRKPEMRLALVPGTLLIAIGLFAYGPSVQSHSPWPVLAVCMGISGLGTQLAATMVYTYATDCYKPQAAEVAAVINFYKSIFAFNVAFYALPFGQSVGFNISFPVLALINLVTLCPVLYLWFRGEQLREKQGLPDIHKDL